MGGDRILPPLVSTSEDGSSEQDFPGLPLGLPTLLRRDGLSGQAEDGTINGKMLGEFDDVGRRISSDSLDFETNQRRRSSIYREVLQSYEELRCRSENLEEAKSKILSYTPGAWIEMVGGMKLIDYDVPKTMSLLLIGPRGSGKSSLVNKISRVFEDDKFASERAQVSYNASVGDGTYFLQEYMIPRGSSSFCLHDTRSLSDDLDENMEMLKHWMTKGVRHGELLIRDSDSSSLKTIMKRKARHNGYKSSEKLIFGVFTFASFQSFHLPCITDDKPVVVVTHGDLLSLSDRARVRVHLGELLGIPPKKQIFDIPEGSDPMTELTIVELLRYSLEHADRNLPGKGRFMGKGVTLPLSKCLFLLMILWIAIISARIQGTRARMNHACHSRTRIDWHTIRHLWLGADYD